MAAIKSYTDIEQSKKLAEILPLESADICYKCLGEDPYDIVMRPYTDWKEKYKGLLVNYEADVIPCWSLSALLKVLPDDCGIDKEDGKYVATYLISNECGAYTSDNPIDACVEMVLKLKENKLI